MNIETREYLEDFLRNDSDFTVELHTEHFTLKRGYQVWSCPHSAEGVEDKVDLARVKVAEKLES